MLFTLSYILSRYFCKSTSNVPHYFFKNQSTLLIIGSFIYFLLITINILIQFYRFIYIFVPIDLYCLNKEIIKDEFNYENYECNSNINGNTGGYSKSTCNNSEVGGIRDKLEKLAGLVYEYFARKRNISMDNKLSKHKKDKKHTQNFEQNIDDINDNNNNNNNDNDNINGIVDINTKIIENYKPDIIKLRDMMTHTIDNIHG